MFCVENMHTLFMIISGQKRFITIDTASHAYVVGCCQEGHPVIQTLIY